MTQIPYTLEEVYQYVKEQLDMNEQDLVEIFELLERNEYFVFRKLFEIFFDYCQFYDKNIDLTIDSVAVFNFLNLFYRRRKGVEKIGEECLLTYSDDGSGIKETISESNMRTALFEQLVKQIDGVSQPSDANSIILIKFSCE